jgi:hypothetical protein
MSTFPLALCRWAAWAPGLETGQAQEAWGRGEKKIRTGPETPPLDFLPPLFRRRLSQLSKMVLYVGHTLMQTEKQLPCIFASHYGEINKQYMISKGLIDTQEIHPATFSLSVFNTPVFLLSIAEGNKDTGSALYAGADGLSVAFLEMLGFLESRNDCECMVLFADEHLPPTYQALFSSIPEPYALGMVFSKNAAAGSIPCTIDIDKTDDALSPTHPLSLLRWLVTEHKTTFIFPASGMKITLRIDSA